MNNGFTKPILIIAFNRYDTVKRVFDRVREIKPQKLFIALDGPRRHVTGDIDKCLRVKNLFTNIDWRCEVKTLYRENNMGCHKAVPDAISWFFTQVNEGIILEDDCLPSKSFFTFCEELLEKYSKDERIMMISGNNFIPESSFTECSYFFSKYAFIWGWATWKRAWAKFDEEMKTYPRFKSEGNYKKIYPNIMDRAFWKTGFENKYKGYSEGWDMKWNYALVSNRGLGIVPAKNLVENIGMRSDATTTKEVDKRWLVPVFNGDIELKHPELIEENTLYDRKVFRRNFLTMINVKVIYKNFTNILVKVLGNVQNN